jgi:hypothetical protein
MKQIASTYTYNKTTGVITLTGVNIDRDQLLLIVNTTRNVTYYNFADSATTLQAFTKGANTSLTLNSSVITASSAHANGDALIIYYDDQAGTVKVDGFHTPETTGGGVIQLIADAEKDTIRSSLWIPASSATNGSAGEGQLLSQNYPMPVSNSAWVLLGTRDWGDDNTPWDITGLNEYSSIRLENNGGGGSEIEAFAYGNYANEMCWTWDGDTRALFERTLGFMDAKPYTAPVQYDGIRFLLRLDNAYDPCISKLYGKKNFTNLGLTNYDLRSTPVVISGTVHPPRGTNSYLYNFTSVTAASLADFQYSGRTALSVFNDGTGTLYISPQNTVSTSSYMVKLSPGEYWECPTGALAISYWAKFGSAGTARVAQIY